MRKKENIEKRQKNSIVKMGQRIKQRTCQRIMKYRMQRIKQRRMQGIARLIAAVIAAVVMITSTIIAPSAIPYSAGNYDKTLQWSLDMIDADIAYQANLVGQGVRVAVIDSGITLHDDLANIIERKNYIESDTSVDDSANHGTIVAGIISASDDNTGILGVAPGALLISLKCFSSQKTNYSYIVKAIYDAVDVYDCDVINLSLGISSDKADFKSAVEYALSKGVTVTAACGNGANGDYFYPASYDGVFSVSAVDKNGTVSSKTQHNDQVTLAAPGMSIYSTTSNGSYGGKSGSSFAVPFVSGAAAVLLSLDRSLTPEKIYNILTETAVDAGNPGYDEYYGYGILNLGNAVRKVMGEKKCIVSPIENESSEDGGLSTVIYNNSSSTFSGVCRLGREEQTVTVESGCAEKLTFTDYAPYGTSGNSVQASCAVYEKGSDGQSEECISNVRECTVKEIEGKPDGDGGATDGKADDGKTDGGATDGKADDGKTDGGATDGKADDGKTDGGATDGKADDGKTDGGATDGKADDGKTDGGATDGNKGDGNGTETDVSKGDGTDDKTDGGATDGKADDGKTDGGVTDGSKGDGNGTETDASKGDGTDDKTDGGATDDKTDDGIIDSGKSAEVFTDVSIGDWFYNDLNEVYRIGLMNGVSENIFAPSGTVTRAMVVTVLYRMAQKTDSVSDMANASNGVISGKVFSDVDADSWYAEAVAWGVKAGIVNGISDISFAPDRAITRQEMAALVYRFVKYGESASLKNEDDKEAISILYDDNLYEYNLYKDNDKLFGLFADGDSRLESFADSDSRLESFADGADVADWAQDATAFCLEKGILNGTEDGNGSKLLYPTRGLRRSEMAAITARICRISGIL